MSSPTPTVITPREVSLGGVRETKSKIPMRYVWLVLSVVVIAMVLVGLIVLLPAIEPTPANTEPTQAETSAPANRNASAITPPMQVEREKRAREEARSLVTRFTELELELGDAWNVQAWGEEQFGQAQTTVADAERAFAGSEFEEALSGYAQGISTLEELLAQGEQAYRAALGSAFSALADRDISRASQALEEASTYQPQSAAVETGQKRLSRLDELIELLAEAGSAASKGQFADAIRLAERARSIDPATQGIDETLRRFRQSGLNQRFQQAMAEGYAALDEQDFVKAESVFARALTIKPGDPAAQQGIEQASTDNANRLIESGIAEAQSHVAAENWDAAILAFGGVRQIDASLREASEGLADARARKELDMALKDMIASPGMLADDGRLSAAKSLLASAEQANPRGERLEAQRRTLDAQIRYASQPATVTLVSDERTDVRMQYHGDLGRFATRVLALRPGSYLVHGGRDGYRDVRFVFDVVPGAQRIEVICVEPIN